ncbi:MAG: HNH endonuclease signature motif containing protein [Patescibacteria group bacterium]
MPNVFCKICKKEFFVKECWLKYGWGKYCSRVCQFKGQLRGKFVNCDKCKKKIWRTPRKLKSSKSGKFFCSKSCQTFWRNKKYSGLNHPLWNGGESMSRAILERSRKKIMCKHCNNLDKRILAVHHRDKNRKNNELSNLIWLCHNCHHLIHYYK